MPQQQIVLATGLAHMNIAAHIEKASPVPGCVAADHPQNNKPESSLVKDQSTSRYYILRRGAHFYLPI